MSDETGVARFFIADGDGTRGEELRIHFLDGEDSGLVIEKADTYPEVWAAIVEAVADE